MEGVDLERCEIRLRTWPGRGERLLGLSHFHAAWVEWLPGGGERLPSPA
jgi:hypothetical protein